MLLFQAWLQGLFTAKEKKILPPAFLRRSRWYKDYISKVIAYGSGKIRGFPFFFYYANKDFQIFTQDFSHTLKGKFTLDRNWYWKMIQQISGCL